MYTSDEVQHVFPQKLKLREADGGHLRKVQARNKYTYTTSEVRSSSVQVGRSRTDGIIGTRKEPQTQPATKAPNLQIEHYILRKFVSL